MNWGDDVNWTTKTTLNYIGSSKELPTTASIGDVTIKDGECYAWIESKWNAIATTDAIGYREPTKELVERKCKCCNAPLKIKSPYDSKILCEYCGSVYEFR